MRGERLTVYVGRESTHCSSQRVSAGRGRERRVEIKTHSGPRDGKQLPTLDTRARTDPSSTRRGGGDKGCEKRKDGARGQRGGPFDDQQGGERQIPITNGIDDYNMVEIWLTLNSRHVPRLVPFPFLSLILTLRRIARHVDTASRRESLFRSSRRPARCPRHDIERRVAKDGKRVSSNLARFALPPLQNVKKIACIGAGYVGGPSE